MAGAALAALAGCATTPPPDAARLDRPMSIAIMADPGRDGGAARRLAADLAPGTPAPARMAALAGSLRAAAEARAFRDFADGLPDGPRWQVEPAPLAPLPALAALPLSGSAAALPAGVARQLRETATSDAVLRYAITDEGLTPKAWRNGVLAFEVASTLGIAGLLYVQPATRALAGVYLAQETAEESVEGYAGFWALDQVWRPVRMQAQLIDVDTGRIAWAGTATGFSDRRLARMYEHVGEAERTRQLGESLDKAVGKLVRDLHRSAHAR